MIALDYIILCLHVLLERTQGSLYVDICAYKFVSINIVVVVVIVIIVAASSSFLKIIIIQKVPLYRVSP